MHQAYAVVLLVLVVAILLAGGMAGRRDRPYWKEWLRERRWAVLLLAAVAVNTLFVALTERPRPEYMYGLTVGIMVLVGAAGTALVRRVGWMRFVAPGAVILLLALLATIPPFYSAGPRPIHDGVQRLQGVRGVLERPTSVLFTETPGGEICDYLAAGRTRHCSAADVTALAAQVATGRPLSSVLASNKVNVIYADPALAANPDFNSVLADPGAAGYRVVASGTGNDGRWTVLVRNR
jgi:hypothetical protein